MANRIPAELQPIIRRMSNWQRNQWARAGYSVDPTKVQRFCRLQRDGTELYQGTIILPIEPRDGNCAT